MKPTQPAKARSRAVIEKPPFAVATQTERKAVIKAPQASPDREARIREAAYARYQARGQAHGHDVEDWLAAEAALLAASKGH